ncbi:hypothetical protein [Nocardia concava]|uniref:hypothetical protein n=1 Tax=Nocardia concava TaxID=257281 RepID=UPI0003180816|nr:hypothetical protein [Nocardia concava]
MNDRIEPSRKRFDAVWTRRTNGVLSPADRRALIGPVVRGFLDSVPGRLRLVLGLHPGRHARIEPESLTPPDSPLARDARATARELMSPSVFRHCQRTWAWAAALAATQHLTFDREVVYLASMLHDAVWPTPTPGVDFTLACAEVATAIADRHSLPAARRTVVGDAICMHHTPGVTLDNGTEEYLVSAGASLDVVGLRAWDLPDDTRRHVLAEFPRTGFKKECAENVRREADLVPLGRLWFFHHYGLSDLTIAAAPFRG